VPEQPARRSALAERLDIFTTEIAEITEKEKKDP
jgi:hypothetical protein